MDLYNELGDYTHCYFAEPINFTLDLDHRIVVWDVKYYANDTLGNWNASGQESYSYNMVPPFYQPDYSIVIACTMGLLIIVAGVVFMKRRLV